jgi:predicted amidohydrolase
MIVDPWGVVLTQAADTECFVAADLDFAIQDDMRDSLPSLRHRRPDAYRWPDGGADVAQASIAESATAAGVA